MHLFLLEYLFHGRYMFCFIRAALRAVWQRSGLWSANLILLKKPDPVQSLDPGPQIVLKYPTLFENKKWYYLRSRSSEILGFLNSGECRGHQVSGGSQHIDASDVCCHSHMTFNFFPQIWEPKLAMMFSLRMMGPGHMNTGLVLHN